MSQGRKYVEYEFKVMCNPFIKVSVPKNSANESAEFEEAEKLALKELRSEGFFDALDLDCVGTRDYTEYEKKGE